MKPLSAKRSDAHIAEHKLLIMRQQKIAAALQRSGETEKARAARGKLLTLLNQLDLMQAFGSPPASPARHNAR